MKDLSEFIEESLETIRPGSRPQGGVNLPKVGAKEAPRQRPGPTLQNSPDMKNIAPAGGATA